MNPKRQAAEKLCLGIVAKMLPNGENLKLYQQKFEAMDDDQFHKFMIGLRDKTIRLVVVMPNGSKETVDIETNFKLAQSLGRQPFERVWMPATEKTRRYLTPIPYLVMPMAIRRQAQMVSKKISLPVDTKSIDFVTGQPTGDSKGAKVSYPEVKVLAAMGLDKTLEELMKYRGGDAGGFRAMDAILDKTGEVSLQELQPYSTGVKSTQAMNHFLKAAHLKGNL